MSTKYSVIFEKFTERHFIKTFEKKYRSAWELTLEILTREFQSFDVLFDKSIAEKITKGLEIQICKTEFKIAGVNISRHGSGNRCIVALNKKTNIIHVLLVYSKNNIKSRNETAEWRSIVKKNYPEYRDLL
ncbi:hypothetical protein KJ671_00895 [Patescibacteria group bacterium]|nr:hypothetical protein [Patescibacteria group bacterium]